MDSYYAQMLRMPLDQMFFRMVAPGMMWTNRGSPRRISCQVPCYSLTFWRVSSFFIDSQKLTSEVRARKSDRREEIRRERDNDYINTASATKNQEKINVI